jgi:hypothetical protein
MTIPPVKNTLAAMVVVLYRSGTKKKMVAKRKVMVIVRGKMMERANCRQPFVWGGHRPLSRRKIGSGSEKEDGKMALVQVLVL